jgi:hypothetical protein
VGCLLNGPQIRAALWTHIHHVTSLMADKALALAAELLSEFVVILWPKSGVGGRSAGARGGSSWGGQGLG